MDELTGSTGVNFKIVPKTEKSSLTIPKTAQTAGGFKRFTIYGNYTIQKLNIVNDFPNAAEKIQAKDLNDEDSIYIIVMLQYTASDNAVSSLPDGELQNSNKYFENKNGNLQLKQTVYRNK